MASRLFKNYIDECYINPWWYMLVFLLFVIVFALIIADSFDSEEEEDLKSPKIIAAIVLGSLGMLVMLGITIRDNSPSCIKAKKKYRKKSPYKPPKLFNRRS
jgi:amino acid permease